MMNIQPLAVSTASGESVNRNGKPFVFKRLGYSPNRPTSSGFSFVFNGGWQFQHPIGPRCVNDLRAFCQPIASLNEQTEQEQPK